MRILVDYRAALRGRTGVGEYIHELVRAFTSLRSGDTVELFTSSWKDRPDPRLAATLGVRVHDRRIPVRVLNALWHRAEWPPVEWLAGDADIAHSAHPLMMPARRAAQVTTIHDLFFLTSPERTSAEIRRDYAALLPSHVRRSYAIITSTTHARAMLIERFQTPAERIYVCPPGPPVWRELGRQPHVPDDGCILFVGTLEPRKNIGFLLDVYAELVRRLPHAPPLVLAGRASLEAQPWLARLAVAPLRGRVTHRGYVPEAEMEALYASARIVVMPSIDEGFGLPALAAMSAGVPVVVSNRGSLPEVVGEGGLLIDPMDLDGWASTLERLSCDAAAARVQAERGLRRAAAFSWHASATTLRLAYQDAIVRRQSRPRS